MKKVIIQTALAATIFYLIGCFTEVSFNLSNWREDARGFIGVFIGISFFAICFFNFLKSVDKD